MAMTIATAILAEIGTTAKAYEPSELAAMLRRHEVAMAQARAVSQMYYQNT